MLSIPRDVFLSAGLLLWLAGSLPAGAQLDTLAPRLGRTTGEDAASGIAYTRLYLSAIDSTAAATIDLTQPTLTAQCTRRPDGKMFFELFVNLGNVTDTTFYPPWKASKDEIFPPKTAKAKYTMEFLGYTKVSPFKREFEHVLAPVGQLRYNPPGGGSANMEPISYFMRYLRSLPTLQMTGEGRTVSFLTTPLLAQLHREALCLVSGA